MFFLSLPSEKKQPNTRTSYYQLQQSDFVGRRRCRQLSRSKERLSWKKTRAKYHIVVSQLFLDPAQSISITSKPSIHAHAARLYLIQSLYLIGSRIGVQGRSSHPTRHHAKRNQKNEEQGNKTGGKEQKNIVGKYIVLYTQHQARSLYLYICTPYQKFQSGPFVGRRSKDFPICFAITQYTVYYFFLSCIHLRVAHIQYTHIRTVLSTTYVIFVPKLAVVFKATAEVLELVFWRHGLASSQPKKQRDALSLIHI